MTRSPIALATVIATAELLSVARAKEPAPVPRMIEEIVVTAQKREQTLQEVPISVSVIGEEFIADMRLTDFRDLALYVPNVSINNTAGQFNDIRIRGFGSPIANKAFEQPVGLVIDGVPYSRLPYWQGSLFDLQRVEVLRGPQGTLFGKNTIAGLFNVVTKKPSDELTGYVDVGVGELDERRFEVAVGGPIVAGLVNFRLAGLDESRDGFMENTTGRLVAEAHDRLNARDRQAVRAQLGFPDVAGANLVVGYEYVDSATNGTGWELRTVVPNQVPFYRYWDPDTDLEPGNWVGSIDGRGDMTSAKTHTLVVNGDREFGDWGLSLVGGYSVLEWESHWDEDFTPAPIVPTPDEDRDPQVVAELRAVSPTLPGLLGLASIAGWSLGTTDVIAGFFFDDRRILESRFGFKVNFPVFGQFAATDATGVVPPCPECSNIFERLDILFEQTSRSYAGFSQMSWSLAERWTLEYGMRFTHETKAADWETVCSEGPTMCGGLQAALNGSIYVDHRSRSESAFTPKVTLLWDWTDDVAFYAGWGEGFKAGGFNSQRANDTDPDNIAFEPEKASSWELGTKMRLLGSATANVALYHMLVEDLQVFTVTPDLQLETVNAGRARSRGVETDLEWLPLDWVSLRATFGLDDSEFLEFPFGTCTVDRPNTDGDDDARCDFASKPLPFTPRWTATFVPTVRVPLEPLADVLPLPGSLEGVAGLGVECKGSHYVGDALDPRERQSSFIRLGASLGIADTARGWSLRVVGQNLTDEDVAVHVRDVSLVGKSFVQVLDPPRLIGGVFRWEF